MQDSAPPLLWFVYRFAEEGLGACSASLIQKKHTHFALVGLGYMIHRPRVTVWAYSKFGKSPNFALTGQTNENNPQTKRVCVLTSRGHKGYKRRLKKNQKQKVCFR